MKEKYGQHLKQILIIQRQAKQWLECRNAKKRKLEYKFGIIKETNKIWQADEWMLIQNRINFELIMKSLIQYKQKSIDEFEADWIKFEKDLYKYETKRNEFKDW